MQGDAKASIAFATREDASVWASGGEGTALGAEQVHGAKDIRDQGRAGPVKGVDPRLLGGVAGDEPVEGARQREGGVKESNADEPVDVALNAAVCGPAIG